MQMNRKLIHIWYNIDKKHLLFTKGNVTSFCGYLQHTVDLPEEDRNTRAEYGEKYLYPSIFTSWHLVYSKKASFLENRICR